MLPWRGMRWKYLAGPPFLRHWSHRVSPRRRLAGSDEQPARCNVGPGGSDLGTVGLSCFPAVPTATTDMMAITLRTSHVVYHSLPLPDPVRCPLSKSTLQTSRAGQAFVASSVALCEAADQNSESRTESAATAAELKVVAAPEATPDYSSGASAELKGEGPSFLEGIFGDCLSYPNVVWAQEVLAAVHEATGLPWWLTIAAATFTARSFMLPMAVYQQRVAAHLQAAAPKLQEVEQEYQMAKTVYKDPGADSRRAMKLEAIYKQHNNCKPWKLFANIGVQAPVFVSCFFGVKDLARTHPDFAQGGFLWARDLSVCDPTHILPALASVTLLAALECNMRARRSTMDPVHFRMQIGIQRIICFSMVPMLIGLKYPAGVFIYWISNNLFTGMQVALLGHSRVRQLLGLPEPRRVAAPFSAAAIKNQVHASFPPHMRGR